MESTATPVSTKERIYTLDVIRGFALLGIFIMNMPWFNTSFYVGLRPGPNSGPSGGTSGPRRPPKCCSSGKFNSMFSMLFAIGFTIQLERLEARDPGHAKTIYLRRIFWLFVFGVIHMCVFWTGDVLHIYALMGLVLLALRRAPYKVLWTLFALCLLVPAGHGHLPLLHLHPGRPRVHRRRVEGLGSDQQRRLRARLLLRGRARTRARDPVPCTPSPSCCAAR